MNWSDIKLGAILRCKCVDRKYYEVLRENGDGWRICQVLPFPGRVFKRRADELYTVVNETGEEVSRRDKFFSEKWPLDHFEFYTPPEPTELVKPISMKSGADYMERFGGKL